MLIQDIKPYKPLSGRVARIQYEASKLHSKTINVRYIKPVRLSGATMFPDLRAVKYEPTEDDYIQDQAFERAEMAREYEAELLRGLDQ